LITLAWPWLLLALPVPALLRWLLPPARPLSGRALRLPRRAGLAGLAAEPDHLSRRWGLGGLLIWLLLMTAVARPQWLGEPVALPVAGRDLILAVDISGSMDQQDYSLGDRPASRLDVVRAVASRFIDRRDQDRIGLILFGTRPYVQTPLTYDRETVAQMLEEAVVGLAGRDTAIGDAIGLGVKRLREQPRDNRVLVLLTDGANSAGALDPRQAAALAAELGIRIYAIGLGGSVGTEAQAGSGSTVPRSISIRARCGPSPRPPGGTIFKPRMPVNWPKSMPRWTGSNPQSGANEPIGRRRSCTRCPRVRRCC
jgi:Ca-activated chloride channel family protein